MNETINRALKIMEDRAQYYTDRAKVTRNELQDRMVVFSAAYANAANILRAAIDENLEVLKEYEGA